MRIDKYLANLGLISRKDCKKVIKSENIFLNGQIVLKEDQKIKFWDKIKFFDEEIEYKEDIFLILNKPKDFVCSRVEEAWALSIYENIFDCPYSELLEIVWRLDKDTTGLVLFTNNWKIIHKLISPKKNILKKYIATLDSAINQKEIEKLEKWVIIDENYRTKKAKVNLLESKKIEISISEGKFHQIKKMLEAVNNKVLELKRIEIWELKLWNLKVWEWRYLNDEETKYLQNL